VVDLIGPLPTPFGLVHAGVAPDHLKIKSTTRVYEQTARKDGRRAIDEQVDAGRGTLAAH
jgi:ferredoxin--NADP+ reductase